MLLDTVVHVSSAKKENFTIFEEYAKGLSLNKEQKGSQSWTLGSTTRIIIL